MPPEIRERLLAQSHIADDYVRSLLRNVGADVKSISEIVNSRASFPKAVPVLVELLDDPNLKVDSIFRGIVASLRDPAAVGVAYEPLVRLYREYAPSDDFIERQLAGDIALTIGYIAEDKNADELIGLLRDKATYGGSRLGLVDGLSRFKDRHRLVAECRWMIHDPELVWTTLQLIGRRKLTELVDEVRGVAATHPRGDFRQLAKRQIAKLEKESAEK